MPSSVPVGCLSLNQGGCIVGMEMWRAAERLDQAARRHRKAAKCCEAGAHETARHYACGAQGYGIDIPHRADKPGEGLCRDPVVRRRPEGLR